ADAGAVGARRARRAPRAARRLDRAPRAVARARRRGRRRRGGGRAVLRHLRHAVRGGADGPAHLRVGGGAARGGDRRGELPAGASRGPPRSHGGVANGVNMEDIRFALRTFRKHPGYAAVVVGTLALALGAVTALFSVADATLIGPLPLSGADRVLHVFDIQPQYGPPANASWPEVKDWRANARPLSALAAGETHSTAFVSQGGPERVLRAYVSR